MAIVRTNAHICNPPDSAAFAQRPTRVPADVRLGYHRSVVARSAEEESLRFSSSPAICLFATITLAISFVAHAAAAETGSTPNSSIHGEKIADFSLPDASGNVVSLADFREKKAIVDVFIGTECPVNNAYLQRLAELASEYEPKGVQFVAINANSHDTLESIAEHAREQHVAFPVLKDEGNRIADKLTAERTPEAFLLDAERRVRYRGRIDDQYGVGYRRPQPIRRDLAVALDETLAGSPVSEPITQVSSCRIKRRVQPK